MPPLYDNIKISIESFPLDDLVPTEDEIDWAVTELKNHCSRGRSGMRDKHIKGWLLEVIRKESEELVKEQATPAEVTTSVLNGTGGGGQRRKGGRRLQKRPTGRGFLRYYI